MKDSMKDIKYISSLQLNSNRCQVICLINLNISWNKLYKIPWIFLNLAPVLVPKLWNFPVLLKKVVSLSNKKSSIPPHK
jgi:hypothetical protein